MKLKSFKFGNKPREYSEDEINELKSHLSNPFVNGAEGRREWNDRYMNMTKAVRSWQLAFIATVGVSVILAITVAKIATESHVEPFVVETNDGLPYALKPMQALSGNDQKILNFAINQFIINARSVVTDPNAEKSFLDKVYAYSADETIPYLREYYNSQNPFDTAKKYSVSVSIIDSMPVGKNSWQIIWDETKRNINDSEIVSSTRWMANVSYQFSDINPKFINDNPFGLYITQLSWSQSQENLNS